MTIAETIAQVRQRMQDPITLPAPQEGLVLLERARTAGIPVRTWYILRTPLVPHAVGSYDRTGDLWCLLLGFAPVAHLGRGILSEGIVVIWACMLERGESDV